ncbi:MAG: cheY 4 [Bacteroidetes bacterium]|jgi:CheY-like chemotaxis protein|nr:cheY 4 [Bacteroidota bacterium]
MRIIIVDDIFTNRLLIAEIVKSMGHMILEAENGREALEMLQNGGKFDLVLMDIEMPVMNGIETTRYIRESMPYPVNQIPVVALTAHNPNLFFDDFQDVGFNQLLTKPYSLEKLKKLIREFENPL